MCASVCLIFGTIINHLYSMKQHYNKPSTGQVARRGRKMTKMTEKLTKVTDWHHQKLIERPGTRSPRKKLDPKWIPESGTASIPYSCAYFNSKFSEIETKCASSDTILSQRWSNRSLVRLQVLGAPFLLEETMQWILHHDQPRPRIVS